MNICIFFVDQNEIAGKTMAIGRKICQFPALNENTATKDWKDTNLTQPEISGKLNELHLFHIVGSYVSLQAALKPY